MIEEVCKHCQTNISITGMTIEYVLVRCQNCGAKFMGGYTAITQTSHVEATSA